MPFSTSVIPPAPGLLSQLFRGVLRWDLLRPFPRQDPRDQRIGDDAAAELTKLLRARADAEEIDRTGVLPDDLIGELRLGRYLNLMIEPALGGLGLSPMNAFRVIETAASCSNAVAYTLAINNGFGSGVYLPLLPDGPLRTLIADRVATGMISGGADTEPIGAANNHRDTTATPVDGGAAYLITGEKAFIGNGPIAELVDVSATVTQDGTERIRLFFVETNSPGFQVVARHEFMGLRGTVIGVLALDSVRVPAERMLSASADGWRDAPELDRMTNLARTLTIVAPSLAMAKLCLIYARDFIARRRINGRRLDEYDELARNVAETAADIFAIESVALWSLLGEQVDTERDLKAAKNLASMACWRTVDRTISLLGGEGYETSRSKASRGVPALPVERLMRDARGLRIAGGVDFLLDFWAARSSLSARYEVNQPRPEETPGGLDDAALSPRCRDHLSFAAAQARAIDEEAGRLTREYRLDDLLARQRTLIALGGIGSELLSMSVVLGRAASLTEHGHPEACDLADVACTASRRRLSALWPELTATEEPDHAAVCARWLSGASPDFLLNDVITEHLAREEASR
jgi:alkylation response protein AidB-like acyl-CoA dehydrogenase